MSVKKLPEGCLVGPFVGELYWECFRFAPYIIYLKKRYPRRKFVVFTRPERFDLYGKYADIFVPLVLRNESNYKQDCFGLHGIRDDDYKYLNSYYVRKYRPNFSYVERILPDIDSWRYKVKWQFPRHKMDYDFLPRGGHSKILKNKMVFKNLVFIDLDDEECICVDEKYQFISSSWLSDFYLVYGKQIEHSLVGFMIELIKRSSFVIGRGNRFASRMALLLGTPLISIDDVTSDDDFHLINPLNTKIIRSCSISEGIKIYEDNI